MAAFFQSLGRTITAGVVVLIVLLMLVAAAARARIRWPACLVDVRHPLAARAERRDVDRPALVLQLRADALDAEDPGQQKPAMSKVIAPTALFWFRWAAMATISSA